MSKKIKKIFSFFFFFFFLIFFSLFGLGNKGIVKINFFPFPFFLEVPLYILVIILLFSGFTLGSIFIYIRGLFK